MIAAYVDELATVTKEEPVRETLIKELSKWAATKRTQPFKTSLKNVAELIKRGCNLLKEHHTLPVHLTDSYDERVHAVACILRFAPQLSAIELVLEQDFPCDRLSHVFKTWNVAEAGLTLAVLCETKVSNPFHEVVIRAEDVTRYVLGSVL